MAEQILNNYKLINMIANGQITQVWEVVEQSSHRHFAMKLMVPERAKDRSAIGMFYHEANVGYKLQHPNVIRIYAVHKSPTHPNFVMEYFPAGSLKIRMLRKQTDFINEKLYSILKQGATGLAYMNASGWVHRDVKPENFLINNAGDLKLIDFAIAQSIQPLGFLARLLRRKNLVQGTRTYMSPEQIRGEPLDGRADIYSYGIMTYELLTGRPPFRAASNQELLAKHITEKPVPPHALNPEVTEEFSKLVMGMLAKKRDDRPATFHEVLMILNRTKIFKNEAPRKKEEK